MDTPQLAQRGRAAIDFHCAVRSQISRLQHGVEAELAVAGVTKDTLPDDMDERHALVDAVLSGSKTYRLRALAGEWAARDHGPTCQAAFAEIRDEIEPKLKALHAGPAALEYDPDPNPPAYFARVWFHRTTGGWDAGDYNGFVHGELIHKLILTRAFGSDIFEQRRRVARMAPRRDYRRILDLGASSGHYTQALSETFAAAEIHGVDLSPRMLEQALREANAQGRAWTLYQRPAEDTGFDGASFDLVSSYNLLHELPPRIIKATFAEAFRLLEPGGDMVMADVPRYADLDKMAAWRFDWAARWGGEPYWRASAEMDLQACAEDAGFIDVEAFPSSGGQPYVVRGRKPEAAP